MITEEERLIRRSQGYDIGFEQNGKKYWINSNTWNKEKEEKLFQETGLKSVKEGGGKCNLVFYDPNYFYLKKSWRLNEGYFLSYKGTAEKEIPQPKNMSSALLMFNECVELQFLNLNDWDMSLVIDCSHMFAECKNLEEILISEWDTKNLIYVDSMFYNCEKLKSLDLSHLDVSKITHMRWMFASCDVLEDLRLPKNFGEKVNTLQCAGMYNGCKKLCDKYSMDSYDNKKFTAKIDNYNKPPLEKLQTFQE